MATTPTTEAGRAGANNRRAGMSATHTPGPRFPYKRPEPIGYAEYEIHYGTSGECIAEVVHGEGNAKLLEPLALRLNAYRFWLSEREAYRLLVTADSLRRAGAREYRKQVQLQVQRREVEGW